LLCISADSCVFCINFFMKFCNFQQRYDFILKRKMKTEKKARVKAVIIILPFKQRSGMRLLFAALFSKKYIFFISYYQRDIRSNVLFFCC
jgi:hypothetical protein